ncbi:MAG: SRPBCC family protein [Nocardioidaceae bacterium]
MSEQRVVTACRVVAAPAERIFELIADPAAQPTWDGNDNLATADTGQRVHGVGEVFTMTLTGGQVRENHVVEFEEGRRIAWRPSEVDTAQPGHLWRWELEPQDDGTTLVTHTYDWTGLTDQARFGRARATTSEMLMASLNRMATVAGS